MQGVWIDEPLTCGIKRYWSVDDVIVEKDTAFQKVLIAKTEQGITLFCNSERQSSEQTQQIYHEGQYFPAALLSDKIDDVLVIGSSEGVICQMAIESGAQRVVHVDIDEDCVSLCAKHLPYGYTEADFLNARSFKGRIKLLIDSGENYIERCLKSGKRFDVVVIDLPDEDINNPEAPHNILYSEIFLKEMLQILKPGGVVIAQAGCSTFWRNSSLKQMWQRCNDVFETAVYFEMEEQNWSWIIGMSTRCDNPRDRMKRNLSSLPCELRFIDSLSIDKATIPPISVRKSYGAKPNRF